LQAYRLNGRNELNWRDQHVRKKKGWREGGWGWGGRNEELKKEGVNYSYKERLDKIAQRGILALSFPTEEPTGRTQNSWKGRGKI